MNYREKYTELKEALVGDSPNWTHDELVYRALVLVDRSKEHIELRDKQRRIHDLLTEVLPRTDGTPHKRVMLWGLESELKRVVGEIAIVLGMVDVETSNTLEGDD